MGTVTVHAVNSLGECEASTQLVVRPTEDLRLKLRHNEELVDTYEVSYGKSVMALHGLL